MDNRTVARYALGFIGGKPKVTRFYNDDQSQYVDIMYSSDGVLKDVCTCATIGVNQIPLELASNDKDLRVEIMTAGLLDEEKLKRILAGIASVIYQYKICFYGMVMPEAVSSIVPDTEMKHVVLMSPVFWPEYKALEDADTVVSWLYAVPISDAEWNYIDKHGMDAFDELLEEQKADVLDYGRKSMV